MFDFLRKKPIIQVPTPVPATHGAQETERTYGEVPLVLLGKMKWVMVQNINKLGIITKVDASSMVNVDLVQEDGTTYGSLRTQVGNVRLAKLEEIPVSRRPTNTAKAATLGYI